MKEIFFDIESSEEIWSLIDKNFNHILIYKFMPNPAIEWWKTNIALKNNETFENLEVRNMEFDIRTDLDGLKKILELNTLHLNIYQFNKPIPNTLSLDHLPQENLERILQENGLQHSYSCNYEFITIASSNEKFIKDILDNPVFNNRIEQHQKDESS